MENLVDPTCRVNRWVNAMQFKGARVPGYKDSGKMAGTLRLYDLGPVAGAQMKDFSPHRSPSHMKGNSVEGFGREPRRV